MVSHIRLDSIMSSELILLDIIIRIFFVFFKNQSLTRTKIYKKKPLKSYKHAKRYAASSFIYI